MAPNIFPSSEQLQKCYPFQDLWLLFFYMSKTSLDGTQSSRRTGNRAHKTDVFFLNDVFATAKCTLRWAQFGQMFARKYAFREGFWQNVSDTFSSSFRPGVSASRSSFAGGEYVHWHIAIASIWHTGENLCFLNTMNWGWSLWQQPMQHQWFQHGNWSSPFYGRLPSQTHCGCVQYIHATYWFLGPFLDNMWHHQSATGFDCCLQWISDVEMSHTFWSENNFQEVVYLPSELALLLCPRPAA